MKKAFIYQIIVLIIAVVSFTSCNNGITNEDVAKELLRLQQEVESKNEEIEELKTKLADAERQLQTTQDESEDLLKEETQEEIPTEFKIKDEIVFYDSFTMDEICSVIVHSIENYTDFDKYSEPDEGMRYVTIDVEVSNLSSEVQSYNGLNYYFRDADSYKYDDSAWGKEPRLGSGDLSPGDKIRGWVTIELPEDIEITEILVSPCYIDPPAIIKLDTPLSN